MAAAELSLPPGPRLPTTLQTLAFFLSPRRYLNAMRRRYGDVVWMSTAFDRGFVMVFDPDAVRQVFQASPDHLRAGEANAPLGALLGDRSVLLLDGAEHLRHRRLLLPPFHGRRLEAHTKTMRDAADREIDAWPRGEPFALLPSFQSLTLEVIMTAIFGVEDAARRAALKTAVRAVLEPLRNPRTALMLIALSGGRVGDRGATRRFAQQRRALDTLIHAEIADRRRATDLDERDDVLSMLLQAHDDEGNGLSDAELRDELVTLLVAGHETTATGLAWTFDLLLHTPRVLAELREDLDRMAAAERGSPVTGVRADVAHAPGVYLDAVVKESLRVRPVVPGIGRVVRGEPFEVGGYVVPPGTEINPSIATIHRRADRYPQPAEFRPERFLEDGAPDTYTWLPFGGGTRRCLGASFALQELRVVVRRVLERTSLRPLRTRPEVVRRRGVTLVPRDGVRVRLD